MNLKYDHANQKTELDKLTQKINESEKLHDKHLIGLEKLIKSLESEKKSLSDQLKMHKNQVKTLTQQLETSQYDVDSLNARLQQTQTACQTYEDQLTSLAKR